MTIVELRHELKRQCDAAGGQRAWAAKHQIEYYVVTDTIQGRQRPNKAILEAMSLRLVTSYEPGKLA